MSAKREKDSADFDLEAFVELFDEALTSDDPSVQKTLQHLMVICALARNHSGHASKEGPLRRAFDDIQNLHRRINVLEMKHQQDMFKAPQQPHSPNPWQPSVFTTNKTTAIPGAHPANRIFTSSSTSFPWEISGTAKSLNAGNAIAERVENLLKDEKYKGSSVGTVDVKIS